MDMEEVSTEIKNKISSVPGSSKFLRFILDGDEKIIHNRTRKNREMFAYNPIEAEQKFGISHKEQITILRILRDKYRCLQYDRSDKYKTTAEALEKNWAWFKTLVDKGNIDFDEALDRIKYRTIKVSLRENYKDVYGDIFALDKVVYKITLKGTLDSKGNRASVFLCFGEFPISKMNDGSQTCEVAEELFGEERKNGENVVIKNVSNLSDVLSRIMDKVSELKNLVFSDITGNSVKVYSKITNKMLVEQGLSKECVDDIMLHHIKK